MFEIIPVYMMEKNRQRRIKRQHKECSLVVILICTVGTFFVTHTPRWVEGGGGEGGVEPSHDFHNFRILTSVYEAITYNYQENCRLKNLEFLQLWFLYCIVTMNGLLVGSYNFIILNL
jgi:hypothetical protein